MQNMIKIKTVFIDLYKLTKFGLKKIGVQGDLRVKKHTESSPSSLISSAGLEIELNTACLSGSIETFESVTSV